MPSGNSPALHADEQVEILLDRPVAIGAVFAGLGEGAAVLADLVGGEVIDVGFAVLDELESPLVELAEVVGGVAELVPIEAEPVDVFLDGVDVLLLFFFGIGVVEAEIGFAAELVGETEVKADGLGVADVKVAVGLGRKARLDDCVAVFFGVDVFGDVSLRKLEVRVSGVSVFELIVATMLILFHGRGVRSRAWTLRRIDHVRSRVAKVRMELG